MFGSHNETLPPVGKKFHVVFFCLFLSLFGFRVYLAVLRALRWALHLAITLDRLGDTRAASDQTWIS